MSTAHNNANLGDIAKTVLMPGDPLRAKHIAETYLTDYLVLADSCWSESTFALAQAGIEGNIQYPSQDLNETIKKAAAKLEIPVLEKRIHSSDVFYHEANVPDHNDFYQEHGCVCVEMESYALFHNAKILGKNAACLLTISDSLVTDEHASAMERQTSFSQMMEVALEAAIMR